MGHRSMSWALLALLLALGACGDDDPPPVGNQGTLVGGPCTTGADCTQKTCLSGGDFPGGTCSVPCAADDHCPAGSTCVDKEGGRCLLACALTTDCRAGYTCKGKKRVDKSGETLVCIE